MSADDAPVTVLSEDECWSLLSSMSLGRVVTILGGKPEIFPVNFVTQRPRVIFRTAEGTKLFGAATHPFVAFEADYHDAELTYGWSVIVKGRALWKVGPNHTSVVQHIIAPAERRFTDTDARLVV